MALVLLFSTVTVGAVVTTTRQWLVGRPETDPMPLASAPTLSEARRLALAELDRLVAAGPYPADRAHRLYEESSGVVRSYVERLDPAWGPELTSTELMDRFTHRFPGRADPASELRTAEAVKFGLLRPDAASTAVHLTALRAWLAEGPEAGS